MSPALALQSSALLTASSRESERQATSQARTVGFRALGLPSPDDDHGARKRETTDGSFAPQLAAIATCLPSGEKAAKSAVPDVGPTTPCAVQADAFGENGVFVVNSKR